jgi:DNA-binding response OmpR family regulator
LARGVSVLLVNHEDAEAAILARGLDSAGFRATILSEAGSAERLGVAAFDVVVVGVAGALPDRLVFCEKLREDGYKGAVVALSRDSTELDKLVDAGADDFAAVPIQPSELVARVRVALRRVAIRAARWGPLEIDRVQRAARLRGRTLALTEREYALLVCLVEAAGAAVSRAELVAKVWRRYDPGSNMVEVHLSRLRDKLGEDADIIQTIRRAGYRLRR